MFSDGVIESSSTTGTGSYTLTGAVFSGLTFAQGFAAGGTVGYFAQTGDKSKWEMGYGTLTIGPPRTLTRATILKSSNAGSAIDWQATDTYYVFSIASADALAGLLAGSLAETTRPWWVRAGGRWWNYAAGLAVSWIDTLYSGAADIRTGIFDAVKALYFPDNRRASTAVGAASKVFDASHIAGSFSFSTSGGARTATLPKGSDVKDGYHLELKGLSTANGIVLTPDAGDGIDGGADGATRTIPGGVVFAVRWSNADDMWITDYVEAPAPRPCGRLTLTSGVPVFTGSVAAATTVYYTPYIGNGVPIWNGSQFVLVAFSELSNVLANTSTGKAGPAAAANNKNYDLFVWSDAGTLRLTRGAAWNADTGRSATTENDLQRVNGVPVNLNAITNGPAAGYGTYLGTVRTNGTATVDWIPGAVAASGTAAVLGVWNAYNRVEVSGLIGDTTDNWSYSTATWRPANNSSTMRVSIVTGLQEDFFWAEYAAAADIGSGSADAQAGIGYDSTTAPSGRYIISRAANISSVNLIASPVGSHAAQPLGFHFMQAVEWGGSRWFGDNGAASQTGLTYHGRF